MPPTAIHFTVPGKPVAWARARKNGKQHFTAAPQRGYRHTVQHYAVLASRGRELFENAVYLFVVFKIERPKSVTRKFPTIKPDKDNFEKIISDALNGIIYHDDAQICAGTQFKVYDDTPGVEVAVWEIGGNMEAGTL